MHPAGVCDPALPDRAVGQGRLTGTVSPAGHTALRSARVLACPGGHCSVRRAGCGCRAGEGVACSADRHTDTQAHSPAAAHLLEGCACACEGVERGGGMDGGRAAEGKSDTRRTRSETLRCRCRRRRRGGAPRPERLRTLRRAGPAALRPLSAPAGTAGSPAAGELSAAAEKGWRAVWGGAWVPSARPLCLSSARPLCPSRSLLSALPGRSGAVPAPGGPRATCLALSGEMGLPQGTAGLCRDWARGWRGRRS